MENQQTSSKQVMLNYGLILGIISVIITVANYAFGNVYEPHWAVSVASGIATVAVIVLGLKTIKTSNGGLLSLGESLKTGLGIALVSGLVFLIYYYVFVNFIEADYFTNMGSYQEAKMIEMYPNMSDDQLENAIEMSKKFSGFGMTSAIILIMSLFFGFIVSLIAGLIMKKTEEVD
jgi:hypothetical protein